MWRRWLGTLLRMGDRRSDWRTTKSWIFRLMVYSASILDVINSRNRDRTDPKSEQYPKFDLVQMVNWFPSVWTAPNGPMKPFLQLARICCRTNSYYRPGWELTQSCVLVRAKILQWEHFVVLQDNSWSMKWGCESAQRWEWGVGELCTEGLGMVWKGNKQVQVESQILLVTDHFHWLALSAGSPPNYLRVLSQVDLQDCDLALRFLCHRTAKTAYSVFTTLG